MRGTRKQGCAWEEHASTVRDPNAYVLAGIRKVAGEGRARVRVLGDIS